MTISVDRPADVAAPTNGDLLATTAINTGRFQETKRQAEDDAAKLADAFALEARAKIAEEQALAKRQTVVETRDSVAIRRLQGETVDAGKADQAVRAADAELDAARRAVTLTAERRLEAEKVAAKSGAVHAQWEVARLHVALASNVRALGKAGLALESMLSRTQSSAIDLLEGRRNAESAKQKLGIAPPLFTDEPLARLDKLAGVGLSGSLMQTIRDWMPNHQDAEALASQQEAQARRITANL